jgi:membrane protease YdiL (CAAX protease family)
MVWRLKSIARPTTTTPTQKSTTHPILQITLGILIAGGILWALGGILIAAGAFTVEPDPPAIGKILTKALIPAIGASFIEEWLFRGLLLGAFLRIAKPATACIANSIVFAFVHFLSPPEGTVITNPNAPLAGFELLAAILKNFLNPQFFAAEFATLFSVGMILAWARLTTGKLWFAIGLHAGWIAAFKAFNLLNNLNPNSPLHPWGIGDSLRSGLLPLAALVITAAICHPVLNRLKPTPAT